MAAIAIERAEHVRLIRLCGTNGELSLHDIRELGGAITAAAERDERLIVIAGMDDFCLGRAREALAEGPSPSLRVRDNAARPLGDFFDSVAKTSLPVMAAIRGRAFGFGCALAGTCDLTVAHPGATFSLPEIKHGIPPTMAMRALLGRVDIKTLADWTLSGRVFDVNEARERLVVTRISDDPEADALALGRNLGRSTLRTVASIKAFLTSVHVQSAPMSYLAGELVAAALAERGA